MKLNINNRLKKEQTGWVLGGKEFIERVGTGGNEIAEIKGTGGKSK